MHKWKSTVVYIVPEQTQPALQKKTAQRNQKKNTNNVAGRRRGTNTIIETFLAEKKFWAYRKFKCLIARLSHSFSVCTVYEGPTSKQAKKKRVRARQCRARKQALCSPYLLCWFSKVPYLSMGWFECAISKRQRAPSRNTARADKKIKQFYFIILILFQQFVVVFIFIILLRSERYILYTYRFSCLLRRAVCVCVRLCVCVFFSRLFCS